ncbi:phage tail tape measure protein [Streptomyces sp. SCL15-4]|uniref:phage tail tape measure protein n=1 Tax=Streptomyces sp. SCL15-4 TaxID=2967221 RepID=UPI002966761B|nr:phage tail tape measure protein [Streptomyces sp. SCL15-4]
MALTVGELNAILSVDDRAVEPALRRAEQALRQTGQQMASDAERAGQQGGEQLGGGYVRGADSQWRDMRGNLVDAVTAAALEAEARARRGGQDAGEALGDGLVDGAEEGGAEAADAAGTGLSKLKTLALGVGAAAGAVLMDAFGQAMEQGQITAVMGAQLGATGPQAARYGKVAGALFKDAVVADFQEGADTIKAIASAGLFKPDATIQQMQSIATNASDVAKLLEVDVSQAANAAATMIRNKLAPNATAAFDLLVAGSRGLGAASEDLLETFTEYAPVFKAAGISGQTAMGLIRQGIQGGWGKDTDKIADAFKELSLRLVDGSKTTSDALKSIGLDAGQVGTDMAAGGKRGEKAMDQVLDAIRKVGPGTDTAKQAVQNLFGGPGEDLGAALFSLNVGAAAKAMDGAKGSADRLGDGMRDNAASKVTAFRNSLQQGVVDFLGTTVIPGFMNFYSFLQQHQGEVKAAAAVIAAVLVPVLVTLGVQALIAGGRMAAAWVMALGPIGWVGLAIGALVVLVISYWDQIKGATVAAWDWISGKVDEAKNAVIASISLLGQIPGMVSTYFGQARTWAVTHLVALISWVSGLPGRLLSALAGLAGSLVGVSSAAWQAFKTAAATKAVEFITWVQGLPQRTASAIGDLSGLLVSKGVAIVQGLWSGIQSMGGWLRDQIVGWAKDAIPGPIADALGIHSPSRVTKAQGQWIARGLIEGLTGSTKQVKAASAKLADIIADALRPGKARSRALGTVSAGTKQLLKLASQEEQVAARLKDAQKKLSGQIAARDKLASDVKKGILDSGAITGQSGSQSPEGILARLQRDRKAAEAFAKHLAALKKRGVRADLLSQIAQAGVDQGGAVAASLASATPAQIKAINAEQAKLASAAGSAGNAAADAMYGAGIRAGQGLVDGLKKQQRSIEAQMLRIAKGMSKSIRKALGIKSPSRVMARVGAYTAEGLRRGIESGRKAVNRSMASLVDTPTPTQVAVNTAAGATPRRVVNQTTNTTYNLQHRSMTIRDLETLQRRQDALARVGRPR